MNEYTTHRYAVMPCTQTDIASAWALFASGDQAEDYVKLMREKNPNMCLLVRKFFLRVSTTLTIEQVTDIPQRGHD